MGTYTRRAVETKVLNYVDEVMANPVGRFEIALLTGPPTFAVDAVLASGVIPRLRERAAGRRGTYDQPGTADRVNSADSADAAEHSLDYGEPVRLRGAWADSGFIHYCLSESDAPNEPPAPDAAVRVLLIACSDTQALPEWISGLEPAYLRTLPIGRLTMREAFELIEAELGGPVDPEAAFKIASIGGFTPIPISIITNECRSNGVLERVTGSWTLSGDPVQLVLIPYLRAQVAIAEPDYASIMFNLALSEPFSFDGLNTETTEVVHQLLRAGELDRRDDGLIEFVAPGGSAGLRAIAPANDQQRHYAEVLASDRPTVSAIRWALKRKTPVTSTQFERASAAAFEEQDWSAVVELAELARSCDSATRCGMHLRAAHAQRYLPQTDRLAAHLDLAESLLDALPAADALNLSAKAKTLRADHLHFGEGSLEAALQVLGHDPDRQSSASELGHADGSAQHAKLLAHSFIHLAYGGRHTDAVTLLEREKHVFDAAPQRLRLRVSAAEVLILTASGQPQAALRQAMSLAIEANTSSARTVSLDAEVDAAAVIAALASGGPAASPILDSRLSDASDRTHLASVARLYYATGEREYVRGNIDAAHLFAQRALTVTERLDPDGLGVAAAALLAETSALRGEHAQAVRFVQSCETTPWGAAASISGTLQAHLWSTQLLVQSTNAGESLRRVATEFIERGQFGFASDTLYAGVRLGRRRAASDLCVLTAHLHGALHEGRLQLARALLEDDGVALFSAIEHLREAGLRLHAAEASAVFIRRPDAPESLRNRAKTWLAAYLSEQSLSGHQLLNSALTVAGEVKLTPRERDVSELMHAGLSNAEIADRLGLSLTTVEGHITRIYRKTGGKRRAPARR